MVRRSQRARFQRLRKLSKGPLYALTIRYGRSYLEDHSDHGPAWLTVGIALVELARYEEAKQAIAKAIDLCPLEKQHLPLSHMGHLFRFAGDYDQAAAWHRRACEACPKDASYHIYLGAVLAKQGRFTEAEEAHRSATRCTEGCIDEAYLNLGFVLRACERFSEAAECFREAIRLDPEYRAARIALRDVERCIKLESSRR